MNTMRKESANDLIQGKKVTYFSLIRIGRDSLGELAGLCDTVAEARILQKATKVKTMIVKITTSVAE